MAWQSTPHTAIGYRLSAISYQLMANELSLAFGKFGKFGKFDNRLIADS